MNEGGLNDDWYDERFFWIFIRKIKTQSLEFRKDSKFFFVFLKRFGIMKY